jgi:hypothetical protein
MASGACQPPPGRGSSPRMPAAPWRRMYHLVVLRRRGERRPAWVGTSGSRPGDDRPSLGSLDTRGSPSFPREIQLGNPNGTFRIIDDDWVVLGMSVARHRFFAVRSPYSCPDPESMGARDCPLRDCPESMGVCDCPAIAPRLPLSAIALPESMSVCDCASPDPESMGVCDCPAIAHVRLPMGVCDCPCAIAHGCLRLPLFRSSRGSDPDRSIPRRDSNPHLTLS